MNAHRKIPIMGRVDAETKAWIDSHPLSQSDLINYGLHLIRLAESNIKDANTYVSTITIEPKQPDKLLLTHASIFNILTEIHRHCYACLQFKQHAL